MAPLQASREDSPHSVYFRSNTAERYHSQYHLFQAIENKLFIVRGGGIRRLAAVVRHVSAFMEHPSQLTDTRLFL
jgi:hypothetical protein